MSTAGAECVMRADRDEIGAGFGVRADGFERDSAGKFDCGAAVDVADPFTGFGWSEIIEQQMRGAAGERFVELGARAHFDLDRNAGMFHSIQCRAHAARGRDVIVLDENRVEESHAMIGDAARARRHFLELAQAGRGFARVENAARCLPPRPHICAPASRCRSSAVEN